MVAIGCTICRQCNLGTCHVGIATQIQNKEEAFKKGLKHFTALEFDQAVSQMVRMFRGLDEEIRQLTAQLGATRLQDLVGRADLLEQVLLKERMDLSAMFAPARCGPGPRASRGWGGC